MAGGLTFVYFFEARAVLDRKENLYTPHRFFSGSRYRQANPPYDDYIGKRAGITRTALRGLYTT